MSKKKGVELDDVPFIEFANFDDDKFSYYQKIGKALKPGIVITQAKESGELKDKLRRGELDAAYGVRDELSLPLVGLMAIPPAGEDPAMHFALLKKLAKRHGLERLSMGMSSDFALAASMGATDIRVGTAIFGDRSY